MSDENQNLDFEGGDTEAVEGSKKTGFSAGFLLTVLKWAAIGLGVIILIVTTTVITISILNKGRSPQNLAASSPEFQGRAEPLSYYNAIDSVRGQTSDESPAIFLVKLSLGYDEKAKEVLLELGQRQQEIQNIILLTLAQKQSSALNSSNYKLLQEELRTAINTVMRTGKIKKVIFREITVMR
jgi:flagellar protein FliL